MRATEPRTVIDNTCCPVCGVGIRRDMPLVELRPEDKRLGLVVALRVDRQACAERVRGEPDKFVHAAEVNQVAH